MAFFQTSVLNKYLAAQDQKKVDEAHSKYVGYFHNKEIQENIRAAKEEQFQEGFLIELFVKILGYTLNPKPDYNLTTELKNEKNAKKCDGAILKNGNALAVIELKGTNTTDLDKVNDQAFNYKNNQTGCIYVIISNFEKLRFFIHNAVDHIEFNLFNMNRSEFEILWTCLYQENLLNGLAERIKDESILVEENITKKLYSEYATFKNKLWNNATYNNKTIDQLLLYKKSQKLLDRFLFILFSEDSGLLPPNTITTEINRWKSLKELDAYQSLYSIFKQFFSYINKGKKGKTTLEDIYPYNGGLFLPDDVLDNISLDDDILESHLKQLTNYNFNSEVDVNILGHIFENSLNEIESVKAKLTGVKLSNTKSKRKKDGVYYTPKYITKYIVTNSVGKVCDLKKKELGITEEEYHKNVKGRRKNTLLKLKEKLEQYREWLLGITICDPACGSGAFLNQALEFLIDEHKYIDELESKLFGSGFVFRYISDHILENNLYGVDINEESVEIAKLSLWLRTAKKGRKLTTLNNNIKCGNSLLGGGVPNSDNASKFVWEDEFPNVFKSGGFDIIIGNPPYIKEHINREAFRGLEETKYYQGKMDLWTYFGCVGIDLLKENGLISYIAPNNWISNAGASIFRNKMLDDGEMVKYIDFCDYKVFEDADIQTMVYVYRKTKPREQYSFRYSSITSKYAKRIEVESAVEGNIIDSISRSYVVDFIPSEYIDSTITFNDKNINLIIDKLENISNYKLDSKEVGNGIDVLQDFLKKNHIEVLNSEQFNIGDGALVLNDKEISKLKLTTAELEWLKPYYDTQSLTGYCSLSDKQDKKILYADKYFRGNIDNYPNLKAYLDLLSPILTSAFAPYGLHRAREENFFSSPSIYSVRKTVSPKFTFETEPCYVTRAFMVVQTNKVDMRYLTCLFNSSISHFWFKNKGKLQGSQLQIDKEPLTRFPIVITDEKTEAVINDAYDLLCKLIKDYEKEKTSAIRFTLSKFSFVSRTKIESCFTSMSFEEFLKNVNPQSSMKISEQAEWEEFFTTKSKRIMTKKASIDNKKSDIDNIFYEIYKIKDKDIKTIVNHLSI